MRKLWLKSPLSEEFEVPFRSFDFRVQYTNANGSLDNACSATGSFTVTDVCLPNIRERASASMGSPTALPLPEYCIAY